MTAPAVAKGTVPSFLVDIATAADTVQWVTHDSENTLMLVHNNMLESVHVLVPVVAALERAWDGEVVLVHTDHLEVSMTDRVSLRADGREITPSRVWCRLLNRSPHSMATAEILAATGVPVLNDPAAVTLAGSKIATAARLVSVGLPVPHQHLLGGSLTARTGPDTSDLGWPQVLKTDYGFGGYGVQLVNDTTEIAAAVCESERMSAFVAQRFVAEASNADIRVLVADGEVAAQAERRAADGDFRANQCQDGSAVGCDVTDEEARIAVAAAQAIGLRVAAVDLIRSAAGPQVLEVNANAGLSALAGVCGTEVYDKVARAICRV